MPEGDTIFRAARTLQRALAGRTIARFETQLAALAAVDRRAPIAGRSVIEVSARGKHLLIALSGGLVLRSHMRMQGSWHLYKPGERWRAPRRDARIVITTAEWLAIAFCVSDAEFLTTAELNRHARVSALGPDLLSASFDPVEARVRLRAAPSRHLADAILHQQSMAGLGNVFKSEVLFLCGLDPFQSVAGVSDGDLDRVTAQSQALMRLNVAEGAIAGGRGSGRVTTGRLNPRERLWVYGRAGKPCFKCGTTIATAAETNGRRTYWCPACQQRQSASGKWR
ncbi:MAG TPA: DNA-formamidopyrimidine glycosylase family protein [Vicinamibacterales bacterium]|nr:DNA-formamidopyrimidine glycosylase family protein [Vicinamibacterales bacterium]